MPSGPTKDATEAVPSDIKSRSQNSFKFTSAHCVILDSHVLEGLYIDITPH